MNDALEKLILGESGRKFLEVLPSPASEIGEDWWDPCRILGSGMAGIDLSAFSALIYEVLSCLARVEIPIRKITLTLENWVSNYGKINLKMKVRHTQKKVSSLLLKSKVHSIWDFNFGEKKE